MIVRFSGYLFATLAFLIYVLAVFSIPQERNHAFGVERTSLATAVSHWVYHAPFVTTDYSGVVQLFRGSAEPLWRTLDQLPTKEQRGAAVAATNDGNGVGYIMAATTAFMVFGLHAWSLPLFTIGLMGVSAAMLVLRCRQLSFDVVVVFFASLTVLLFTRLVWAADISGQIPIGGIRYFSLAAILPAFHLVFEALDARRVERRGLPTYLLLVAQVVILLFAILVRTSAATLLAPVAVVWLVVAWRRRHEYRQLSPLIQKGTVAVLAGIGFLVAVTASTPANQDRGLTSLFWHRAVISLGVNPAWPFGNVSQMFDCQPGFAGGLRDIRGTVAYVPMLSDAIGHCIWLDHALKHGIPADEMGRMVYGPEYERVMRDAFVTIALDYPAEVLTTIFYYKPKLILRSLTSALAFNMSAYPPPALALLAAVVVNLFGYWTLCAIAPPTRRWPLATIMPLFIVACIPPYLSAWALPHTVVDLLVYCVLSIGLLVSALAGVAGASLRRTAATQPSV